MAPSRPETENGGVPSAEPVCDLSKRVAVVTGGGHGIGEACARLLKERGARVAVADIDRERAETVAADVDGLAAEVDVTDPEALASLVGRVDDELGPADIVVTSAGVVQRPRPPEELTLEEWDRVMEIDLKGTYLTCVAFGSAMARRGSGSIVTIASVAGMRGVPLHSYGPAKAGVISLTAGLASEWGRSGVRVNCVSPGYTLTPGLLNAIEEGYRDRQVLEEHSALGRLVEPAEIAKAVAFLVSDEAAAVTGANLPVDAGWLTTGLWPTYGGVRPARHRDDDRG